VTFAYLPQVDAAGHRVGTGHSEYRSAVADVDGALAAAFERVRDVGTTAGSVDPDRTLLLVTADHGHVDTGPRTNVDLRGPRFAPLWGLFRRRDDGTAVPPTGSPRQLHLHLRDDPEAGTAARRLLDRELDALVLSKDEAFERELWGPGVAVPEFRRRCGDLVVVPRRRGVWYDGAELGYVGMHGGLTREEMLVPLAAARLSDVV
jgi:predicted AlkP superfamily pyrophosphatase or phosphodiesterase